jgi:hypothetical protein
MPEPTAFILPVETLNGLVEYLAKRPYIEVAKGIADLSQLQPYVPPKPDAPTE